MACTKPDIVLDCSQGPVRKPPKSFRKYQISFRTDPNARIVYVVYYAFSPDAEQGYVCLRGGSDGWAGLNEGTILHWVEGSGFALGVFGRE
jgi:hypothetical protein